MSSPLLANLMFTSRATEIGNLRPAMRYSHVVGSDGLVSWTPLGNVLAFDINNATPSLQSMYKSRKARIRNGSSSNGKPVYMIDSCCDGGDDDRSIYWIPHPCNPDYGFFPASLLCTLYLASLMPLYEWDEPVITLDLTLSNGSIYEGSGSSLAVAQGPYPNRTYNFVVHLVCSVATAGKFNIEVAASDGATSYLGYESRLFGVEDLGTLFNFNYILGSGAPADAYLIE